MNQQDFDFQMQRVTGAFGDGRAYSRERVSLIWKAVCDLNAHQFSRMVDHFIGTFRQAPLPKDFADAARNERKNDFEKDVNGAVDAMNTVWPDGMQRFLTRDYPGCKTLNEAVKVQILKNQVARANGEAK